MTLDNPVASHQGKKRKRKRPRKRPLPWPCTVPVPPGGDALLSQEQTRAVLADCSLKVLRHYVEKQRLHPREYRPMDQGHGRTVYLATEVYALVDEVKAQPPGRARFRSIPADPAGDEPLTDGSAAAAPARRPRRPRQP